MSVCVCSSRAVSWCYSCPNLAHWRCRWWLLRGRFPYVRNTPTDLTHLRFFTLAEARDLLKARRVRI